LRVATYNIHKCRGLDRRVRPERILDVLKHINADIIALQEVLSIEGGNRERDSWLYSNENRASVKSAVRHYAVVFT
jgi:endonuclease/exonuclease/phosphatase family metal-dependent hydrolase